MRRRGRSCASCRICHDTYSQGRHKPTWRNERVQRAIQQRPCGCKKRSGRYSPKSGRRGRRENGGGNDGLWTPGKPKAGFPRCPQPLEIAAAIPTFPPPRRAMEKVESPKPGLPTFPQHTISYFEFKKGDLEAGFALLQAHRSIRKCCTRRT
jgi:hypothetical protein